MFRRTGFVVAAVVVVGWVAVPSIGQQFGPPPADGVRALEQRVQALETVVVSLMARIAQLEAAKPAAGVPVVGGADMAQLVTFGAVIVSDDGAFLGTISTDQFDRKSIMNNLGPHGSEIGRESIFNTVGRYGSTVSPQSAFNDIANSPPKLMMNGQFIAYLTTNKMKSPRIEPHALIGYLKSKE